VGVPVNLLLVGSDQRTGAGNRAYGNPAVLDTARADTTMLVHIAADRTWVSVLSIPRDTVTTVPFDAPACGSGTRTRTRINEAFTAGGPACTVAAVEQMSGVHINHVMSIDFSGFVSAIDHLGGLRVCLRHPVHDTNAALTLPAGTQTVNGKDVLALMRARKTLADGSDLSRVSRQQYLLKLLARQLQTSTLTDPYATWQAVHVVADSLTTDRQLASARVLADAVSQVASISGDHIYTATLPTVPDPANPQETVVVDTKPAEKYFADIAADTPPLFTAVISRTGQPQPSSSSNPDAGVNGETTPPAVHTLFCAPG